MYSNFDISYDYITLFGLMKVWLKQSIRREILGTEQTHERIYRYLSFSQVSRSRSI